MLFNEVIEKMNLFTISAVRTSDLAISARKMMNWDKEEWATRPCLATAGNRPDLDESQLPLIHSLSEEMSKTFGLVFGKPESCEFAENGGVPFGSEKDFISVEHIIGTQIILYNYCLLEAYEFNLYNRLLKGSSESFTNEKFSIKDFQNRGSDKLLAGIIEREQSKYERMGVRKRIETWIKLGLEPIPEKWLEIYDILSERRNNLTHDAHPEDVDLKEAIIYFHHVRLVAKEIAIKFNDKSIVLCKTPWQDFPEV